MLHGASTTQISGKLIIKVHNTTHTNTHKYRLYTQIFEGYKFCSLADNFSFMKFEFWMTFRPPTKFTSHKNNCTYIVHAYIHAYIQ